MSRRIGRNEILASNLLHASEFRRFVEATGYVTVAEIPPDPKDYPRRVARATTSYGI